MASCSSYPLVRRCWERDDDVAVPLICEIDCCGDCVDLRPCLVWGCGPPDPCSKGPWGCASHKRPGADQTRWGDGPPPWGRHKGSVTIP